MKFLRLSPIFLWLFLLPLCLYTAPVQGADATSFDPTLVSVEAKSFGGVPVGTIVAWPVATNPSDWDKWLECNGQSISQAVYPELCAIIGLNTPDLRGRVLQERGTPGQQLEAGLPNITGSATISESYGSSGEGAFKDSETSWSGLLAHHVSGFVATYNLNFNASHSNPIYGSSDTVQPPAYTVRYLIRALP